MNDNKAILISAAIIAGAIALSSILILTRDQVREPSSVTSNPSPSAIPLDTPLTTPIASTPPSTNPEPVTPIAPPIASPVSKPIQSFPPSVPPTVNQPQPIQRPNLPVSPLPTVQKSTAPVNQPAADSFIQSYYNKLQTAQYQSAWQDLSGDFQGNRSANPGGYGGEYLKWWSSFGKQTKVKKIETVKTAPDKATVRAHCQFNGKSYIAQYYLKLDTASGAWKIYGIDKLS
jgi:serine/threonine protein kinase, bacterial